MARMIICSNLPDFTKEIRYGPEDEITVGMIEEEVLKRMKTILSMGKITCEAEYSGEYEQEKYQRWLVNIKTFSGTTFVTCWVRVYQFDNDKRLP